MHGAAAADLGEILTLWGTVPFAGMLLSIALFPLFAPKFWQIMSHYLGAGGILYEATTK